MAGQCRFSQLLQQIPILKRLCNRKPTVAVLYLSGVIDKGNMLKRGLTLESINEDIEKAFSMAKVASVALIINSPGGLPVQSALIHNRIRQLSAEKNIPVIAFCEDIAASGGYWLACAGDEIFANENSIIGSIGVVSSMFGFHEAIKKIGIERRLYKQGENKALLDPFLPEKQTDVQILLDLQKDAHDSFKAMVRTRREGKLKGEEELLFSGAFWSGKKALEFGLIDGLGDMYSVLKTRFGDEVQIKKIGKDKPLFKRLIDIKTEPLHMAQHLADSIITTVKERLLWGRFGL